MSAESHAGVPDNALAMRRVAIVPAFNEEKNIVRVLAELRSFDAGLDVVVISDGSTDRTREVAEAHGARVLQLPFNLGIGGAVQTGFRYAWENGYDLASTTHHSSATSWSPWLQVALISPSVRGSLRPAATDRLPCAASAFGCSPGV